MRKLLFVPVIVLGGCIVHGGRTRTGDAQGGVVAPEVHINLGTPTMKQGQPWINGRNPTPAPLNIVVNGTPCTTVPPYGVFSCPGQAGFNRVDAYRADLPSQPYVGTESIYVPY
ncbi:MAG: hypothetical protein V3W34_12040 [Phycisphaerae bacterium]